MKSYINYYDGIKIEKHPPIRVYIGQHFKDRFIERWGNQPDIPLYLNQTLNEGCIVSDVVEKGLYFPIAGAYVPLTKDNFAITFQFKLIKTNNRTIKVIWSDHDRENIKL